MEIIDRLRMVHSAEVVQLSAKVVGQISGIPAIIGMLRQYIKYLAWTWSGVLRTMVFLCFSPLELTMSICFALGASVVMTILLIYCIISNIPYVEKMFQDWSHEHANSLSPVNARDGTRTACNIFRKISPHQVDLAKMALQQPPIEPTVVGERIFNLDIAKLLLQLSALMYERGTQPINQAIAAGHAHGLSPATKGKGTKDSKIPLRFSEQANGSLSLHPPSSSIAAEAVNDKLHNNLTDNAIRAFCNKYGLEYAAVSELNACDSAYSALFWDPSSNWIVLAFKGTSPTEYTEWVTDFSYTTVDAGDWLPGFGQVHEGFLERLFPADISEGQGMRPWDNILKGIRLLAEDLRANNTDPRAKINLYLTGHSLGCAIASLAFARLGLAESDLDEHILLRDGYLFAAPIVCDFKSVKAFDGAVNKYYDMPKTLWRITNMKDVVATGLPDFGDQKNSLFASSMYTPLRFAHLGAEIKMRSKPVPCRVVGWPHITRGVPVLATSNLRSDLVGTLGVNETFPEIILTLEQIPFIGRLVQHSSFCYWYHLQRVGTGECHWI